MLLTIGKDSGHEIIDYRELRLRLPYLSGDELASELDAGRIASFVNTGCGFEERRLPRHYDRDRHAWLIDEDEARAQSILFDEEDVRRLEKKYPAARPKPEPYCNVDWLPEWVWQQFHELADTQADRDAAQSKANWLMTVLNSATERATNLQVEIAERVASLQAEIAERDRRIAELEAKLAERGRSVAALEAKPSEEDKPAGILPCIGTGLPRKVCDLRRRGFDGDMIEATLYNEDRLSYMAGHCIAADQATLNEDVEKIKKLRPADEKEFRDKLNGARNSSGQKAVHRGQKKLEKFSYSQASNQETD